MPVLENYAKQKQLFEEAVPAEAFEYEGEPKHLQAMNPFATPVVDTNITAKKLLDGGALKIRDNQVSPIKTQHMKEMPDNQLQSGTPLDNEQEIELEDK